MTTTTNDSETNASENFFCTRCRQDVDGTPSFENTRNRLCADCYDEYEKEQSKKRAAQREKNRQSSRRYRERKRAEKQAVLAVEKKREEEKMRKAGADYICTHCGRLGYGEPARSGAKSKVCQLCVNSERERARNNNRERMRKKRAEEEAARALTGEKNQRICEKCGERKYIYAYRRIGAGHSRWCEACEDRFGRFSRRKEVGGDTREDGSVIDPITLMVQRQNEAREKTRRRDGNDDDAEGDAGS